MPIYYRLLLFAMLPMIVGCRVPKVLAFIEPTRPSLFYDTSYEGEIAGLPTPEPGSLADDFRWRYRDSLAEPVAVLKWDPELESRWHILFATNRTLSSDQSSGLTSVGNPYSNQLSYGECAVTLSHLEPDPLPEPDNKVLASVSKVIPAAWKQELAESKAELSDVEETRALQTPDFYSRLNDQISRSRQRDLLIFVHGFNVSFEESVTRLAQVAKDLPFNGAVVAYSWPSQGGVGNYLRDGEIINESVEPFNNFLNDIQQHIPPDTKVNIVVHSMGNRLVLRGLKRFAKEHQSPIKPFQNVVFCAPDVGVNEFTDLVTHTMDLSKQTTLYRCLNDSALIASSKLNREERAGGSLSPVIIDGLDCVDCTVVDTSLLGHSYYGSNSDMLRDLFSIIKENRPATDREWLKAHNIPTKGPMYQFQKLPVDLQWAWHFDESSE